MSNRRLERLRVVQALFQIDVTGIDWKEALTNTLEEDEEITPYMEQVVSGTIEHLAEIDQKLKEHLINWTLDRIGKVDRAIMRAAVYEMMYLDDIPEKVTLNEAIELGKAFGGVESGKFINGVLSKIKKVEQK